MTGRPVIMLPMQTTSITLKDITPTMLAERAEQITGHDADALFLAAIETADGQHDQGVEHVATWRLVNGWTVVQTTGRYEDGQSADLLHVRDADGEFIDAVPAS